MRKLLCIAIAFVSGCAGCDEKQGKIIDVGPAIDAGTCNPLSQAGCQAGEKCTWIVDAVTPVYVGHIGCTSDGAAVAGESCSFGAPGATGFDNCKAGFVCGAYAGGTGECKQICDQQGGAPMCDALHVCVTYSGLFSTSDTMPPSGGVCDLACDPIADNDFDGSGTKTKTGTTCGSDANVGCYGYPSGGTAPKTGWSCTDDFNAMQSQPIGLRHRVQCIESNNCADPGPRIYINSCNQGYVPLLRESTAVSTAVCVALCEPKNCYLNNCGGNTNPDRLGAMPNRCNDVDRVGTFDNAQGGEHCRYLWSFELDGQGAFLRSPTSDTVGFCFDHSKYLYDSNGDNMADMPLPACATLPDGFGSGSAWGAADIGCVDTSHAQLATGKTITRRVFDDLRPLARPERIAK